MSKNEETQVTRYMNEGEKMQLGNLSIKLPKQFREDYDQNKNIKTFGVDNLYPQQVRRLINGSPTGSVCRQKYCDFIEGRGFEGGDDISANNMQSLNDVLHDLAMDEATYNGHALHIRYNGTGEIIGIRALPLETLRLGECDDMGYFRTINYCADWSGLEQTRNGKDIDPDKDVIKYFPYSDNIEVTLARIEACGGAENYEGEVLYVSNRYGYPIGRADAILTALSTEEALLNISYRNARTNFLPSSVLVLGKSAGNEFAQFKENMKKIQGDQNALKILTLCVNDVERDAPKVLDLGIKNYDKDFETTSTSVVERIYSAFKQDVFYLLHIGKLGWGADVIGSAFNTYNISVRAERATIERTFKRIAKRAGNMLAGVNFEITPLVYDNDATAKEKEQTL